MVVDLADLAAALPGVVSVALHHHAIWAEGPAVDVQAMADAMAAAGVRLAAMTATPQSPQGETTIIYHYVTPTQVINVRTATRNGALASIAATARPAGWSEREIKDLFGVEFPGHPNLVPLLKPAGFASGMMREAMCGPLALARSPAAQRTP